MGCFARGSLRAGRAPRLCDRDAGKPAQLRELYGHATRSPCRHHRLRRSRSRRHLQTTLAWRGVYVNPTSRTRAAGKPLRPRLLMDISMTTARPDPRTTPLPGLAGKVAIVTGAAQGIGSASARLFAEHSARGVINVLEDNAQARKTLAEIGEDNAMLFQADVTDVAAIRRMVDATVERFGSPDVLVNNAGINVFNDPLKLSDDEGQRCFEGDLKGVWKCSHGVLPPL